jgi:hypothetical protein
MALAGVDWYYMGGYTYLHRDVPLYRDSARRELASANYLIAHRGEAVDPAYRPVDQDEDFTLLRRDGGCSLPPPGYSRDYEIPRQHVVAER